MIEKTTYKRKTLLLILLLSAVRLVAASVLELANDESYYWFLSQDIKWNYFDHPPLVAVWIRFFTANLLMEKYVVFLRLGSIAGSALSAWFISRCVAVISSERAAWFAACLYTASFYAGITAGLLIMPDSPQMVFYTFSLWMLSKITMQERAWLPWILFGIGTGLCIMSKVHGVFIWIGLGMYVLLLKRTWLYNTRLYAALAIAFVIASPILIWNFQHDFLTYRFNSGRISTAGFSLKWYSFFTALFKQLIINNPFNTVFICIALISWRKIAAYARPALSVFNFIGIPLALVLLLISFYRPTLPHWSGPAYVALIPLAAVSLERISKAPVYPRLIYWSLGSYLLFLSACTLVINYYPGTFGSKIKDGLGKGDITLDMAGWKDAGKEFARIYREDIQKGIMQKRSPMVCNTWWGAHEEYYFCRSSGIQMIGLGAMHDLHEYMWTNIQRRKKVNFSTAYCVVHSDENYNVYEAYKNFYSRIDTAAVIHVLRNKKPAHNFYIFQLRGWKNNLPVYDRY